MAVGNSRNSSDMSQSVSFEVLPCNSGAHRLSMDFAHGEERFGAISGPHGCGKSHLLREAAQEAHSNLGASVGLVSASDLDRPSYGFGRPDILIVDDIEANSATPKCRHRLAIELERRVRSGRPTLCAASSAPKRVWSLLPFPRRWRHEEIREPSLEEREGIIRAVARDEDLKLADDVVRAISKLIRGDGRTLRGAIKLLKFACRRETGEISPIRAVGVLDPLIAKDIGFDLRDVVVDCVCQSLSRRERQRDGAFQDQLTTFVLRSEALLAEANVAKYLGITPGQTFRLLRDARERLINDDAYFGRKLEASKRMICRRLGDV